jgi:hypothetical protein
MNLSPLFEDDKVRKRERQVEKLLAPVHQALEAPSVLTFRRKRFRLHEDENGPESFRPMGYIILPIGLMFLAGDVSAWPVFVLGYYLTFAVAPRVDINLQRRRWVRRSTGVWPFTWRTAGSLDEWEQVRFAREHKLVWDEESSSGKRIVLGADFWSVGLVARAGNQEPPPLPGFDLPCKRVSRAEALALVQQLARKLDLPLREEAE